MKIVKTATAVAVAMSATSAIAGSVEPVSIVDPIVIQDDEPMGSGSGAWILPLILLGVVGIAIANSDDDAPVEAPVEPPAPPAPAPGNDAPG